MLTTEQMKNLKKVNVSKDADKSKTRISEDFKSSSGEIKTKIVELSGLGRNTFYKSFNTGNASAKVVLAMAQTLDVSPYYYIGEADDKDSCTDELIIRFLGERKYKTLVDELEAAPAPKPKRKYNRKQKEVVVPDADDEPGDEAVDAPVEESVETVAAATDIKTEDQEAYIINEEIISYEIDFIDEQDMRIAVEGLEYDEAALLLQSLFIRAKAGGDARRLAEIVKRCLLS